MRGTNRTTMVLAAAITAITVSVTGALATAGDAPALASAEESSATTEDGAHGSGIVGELRTATDRLDNQCEGWRDGDHDSVEDSTCADLLAELDAIEIRLGGPTGLPVGPRHVATPVVTGP